MVKAHQITNTSLAKKPVAINVSKAVLAAKAFAQQAIQLDNDMFDKWIAGDVDYDTLNTYFDTRLRGAAGSELTDIEALKLKTKEKKQDIEDTFHWNQFVNGDMAYPDYVKYLDTRQAGEQPDTPSFLALENDRMAAVNKQRGNEELLMADKFDLGQLSYDEYSKFLDNRLKTYAPDSDRFQQMSQKRLQIEPQYRVNELQKLFASGYWGNPDGKGGFDYLTNLVGYKGALDKELGRYSAGSPQAMEVFNLATQTEATIRDYRYQQDVNTASRNRDVRYQEVIKAQDTMLKLQNMGASPEDIAAAEKTYNAAYSNYQQAEEYLTTLSQNPQNLTRVPASTNPNPQQPGSAVAGSAAAGREAAAQLQQPTGNQAPSPGPVPTPPDTTKPPAKAATSAFDFTKHIGSRPSQVNPKVSELFDVGTGQGYVSETEALKAFVGVRPSAKDPKINEYFNTKTNEGFADQNELFKFASQIGIGQFKDFNRINQLLGVK